MRRHEKSVHFGERLHVCSLCDKSFTSKQWLKIHEKIHDGELDFECDHCSKLFATQWSLNIHVERRHSDERPHACKTCKKRSEERRVGKEHTVVHEASQKRT